jgi:hypothetical protein
LEKKSFRKNVGTKNTRKNTFFSKISRSKSPDNLNYTKGTNLPLCRYAQKKNNGNNNHAACSNSFFRKSRKKPKKRFEIKLGLTVF